MVVALFPGQGSQHVGMAKDLYDSFPIVRETFEEASDAIRVNLKKLCFDGPESDLKLTENTQPCLLAASIAAFRVAQKEWGFTPTLVAGHSLGEYSALVAAHALSLPTAMRWVRERGRSMQLAVPAGEGAMAAILGLEDAAVEKLCEKATELARKKRDTSASAHSVEAIVQPANYNAPNQLVIAGSTDALAEAMHLIRSGGEWSGGKAMELPVSAPFHCPLMEPARTHMEDVFSKTPNSEKPSALSCPYIPNRTARPTQEPSLVLELLTDQITHPVLWKQSMARILEEGFPIGIEFGPGSVLQGLAKRIARPLEKHFTPLGIRDCASLKTTEEALSKMTSPSQGGPHS